RSTRWRVPGNGACGRCSRDSAPRLRHAAPAALIISRAPLRFSLGGGGTDLPAYASLHGGYVVSAAIDKYVYITASRRFRDDIRLAYSKTEIVAAVADIEHPIFREALRHCSIDGGF